MSRVCLELSLFFFNDTATTEIYTLSLHDALPIYEVFAGTQNLTGVLEVRVTRAGEDTTLGRVRELILAAEKTKLPIMRIIDQYMVYYTPLVLALGAMVWAFTKDLDRVITVLVIGCPC